MVRHGLPDILNHNNSYRYLFEPFGPTSYLLMDSPGAFKYIRPCNKDKKLYNFVHSVMSGRKKSLWINKYNRRLISKKRIIKEIHINTSLKWIKNNFPEIPVIFLLRHPFAVAFSRTVVKWWDADCILNNYLVQKDLVEDFLKEKLDAAYNLKDDFSKFVFIWCIENIVPPQPAKRK